MNLIDPKQGGNAASVQRAHPVRPGRHAGANDNRSPQPPGTPGPASQNRDAAT